MNEIQQLTEKVEMLEARCQYLGEVFDALIYSLPDKQRFLELLTQKTKQHDANSLYDQSLSDRQQALVQHVLEKVVEKLSATLHSQD